ncbi:unnamed protein product [Bursaphelenchus xylophilus]|uniref:(pine wood nematode) hypothetical protein n=1 Tax=Bursaphelenchus xylophilus TaxID=6326 RepID=A0A1I7RKM2_BURXY|nr:unnamed protein product [Bursaphelenchus xylophilus]CAG9131228.1 unnamed protein product [Bursaphelenchus xylophilus]
MSAEKADPKPQKYLGFNKKVTDDFLETKVVTTKITKTDKRAALVSTALLVIRVDAKSNFGNVLDIGDFVVEVNGVSLKSKEQFYVEIKTVLTKGEEPQPLSLKIRRPKWIRQTEKNQFEQELGGFSYHTSLMILLPGSVLGMNIRAYNMKVYVSRVEPNSLAARSIRIGDCILGVDDVGCTSVKHCLDRMNEAMKKDKAVILTIERPESIQAVEMVKCALRAQKQTMVDSALAKDAVEIGKRESERIRAGRLIKPKPIYRRVDKKSKNSSAKSNKQHVQVKDKSSQLSIGADPFNPIFMARVKSKGNDKKPDGKSPKGMGTIGGIGNFDK